jgi:hypothetical protein
MKNLLFLVAFATCPSGCASTPPLRAAVETHLRAVQTRNLDALLPTITSGSDLRMIAPDGFQSTTRAEYIAFHRRWFAASGEGGYELSNVVETALARAAVI